MSDSLGRTLDRARWPLRAGYLAILLLATLANLEPEVDAGAVARLAEGEFDVRLTPKALVDAARNVVLFAGWGLVWMVTAPGSRAGRSLVLAAVTGLGISVGVEVAQLFSRVRDASALDVLSNTSGALLGAVTVVVLVRALARRRHDRSFVGLPAALFAGGYGLAALGEAFIPLLRQDRLPVWGAPWHRFRFALDAFEPESFRLLPWSEFILFLPAGFFFAAALKESGRSYKDAAWIAAVSGSLLVVAAEVARGGTSLAIRGGPLVVHVIGVLAGAVAAAWLLPRVASHLRGRERPQLLFAIYAGLVFAWFLRPYVPQLDPGAWLAQLSGRGWMPMAFAADRMDLFSVVDVTNVFFLFLPLGGLLAVWPLKRSGWLAGVTPALLLAVAAEFGQLFVVGRTLTAADVLIAAAAAWTGWVIVRRAGFPVRGAMDEGVRATRG